MPMLSQVILGYMVWVSCNMYNKESQIPAAQRRMKFLFWKLFKLGHFRPTNVI